MKVTSIVFAAGKGTRMTGFSGNKTLLPLVAERSLYEGTHPLIGEVLRNLPPGPKGIVVNHLAEEVRRATEGPGIIHIPQPETNGTGGALLASRSFLESADADQVIITMGDVPLIRPERYLRLLETLEDCEMAILAFEPANPAQYGMLEMEGERVKRIIEWKYWSNPRICPPGMRARLRYCNAGVYAARKDVLLRYIVKLEGRPHEVRKERDGKWITIREYFLTDLAEMMHDDGLSVGMVPVPEQEVIGVDTPDSLEIVQKIYGNK